MLGTKSLLAILIVTTFAMSNGIIFAQIPPELLVTTDKPEYHSGDILIIHGLVEEKKMPVVAMKIFDPLGVILSANSIELDGDNSFTKIISLDSPFYDLPGTYLVNIEYGKLKSETTFEIVGEKELVQIPDDLIEPSVLAMVTDKDVYYDNDFVVIAGIVTAVDESSVLIGIYDKHGTPTGFYFADVDQNYEFSTSFMAKAGVNFKTDGVYSAIAHYGDSENKIDFEFAKQKPNSLKENKSELKPEPKESSTKNNPVIVKPNPTITKPVQPLPEQEPVKQIEQEIVNDNLSVEDIELGKLLNEIQLNCDTSQYSDSVLYYDGMGPALLRLCKYNEAIMFIDKSLQDEPNNIEILTNKGIVLSKLGYYKEALTYFDHVLSIDSRFVPAINNKANVLATLGDFHQAKSLYVLSQEIEPGHYSSKVNLSKIETTLEYEESETPIIFMTQTLEEKKTDDSFHKQPYDKKVPKVNNQINLDTESPTILKQIESTLANLKNTILSFLS
jgi:tetratricopeptide (TPR) repeat protein